LFLLGHQYRTRTFDDPRQTSPLEMVETKALEVGTRVLRYIGAPMKLLLPQQASARTAFTTLWSSCVAELSWNARRCRY
jgi:hypothetical protein